jgi:hypothetical protein
MGRRLLDQRQEASVILGNSDGVVVWKRRE